MNTELIEIGYWTQVKGDGLPMPVENSSTLSNRQRHLLVLWLATKPVLNSYKGSSYCRLCPKKDNGSTDRTDGVYIWPDGLAHYVRDHKIALPAKFVDHVMSCYGAKDHDHKWRADNTCKCGAKK